MSLETGRCNVFAVTRELARQDRKVLEYRDGPLTVSEVLLFRFRQDEALAKMDRQANERGISS
jgi:hypothetical protein